MCDEWLEHIYFNTFGRFGEHLSPSLDGRDTLWTMTYMKFTVATLSNEEERVGKGNGCNDCRFWARHCHESMALLLLAGLIACLLRPDIHEYLSLIHI